MPIVSEQYSRLVGVDTHAATHTLAVVDAVTGAEVDRASFPTTASGLHRAAGWAARRVGDVAALFVVEGAGSYGAGLVRVLTGQGRPVVEPSTMPKGQFRGTGKSDQLDARRIARSVAGIEMSDLRWPREDGGTRAAMRVLVVAREEMTTERTRLINSLTGLVRVFDLDVDARRPLTGDQIAAIGRWRTRAGESLAQATARAEAVRLATRIRQLDQQLADNRRALDAMVDAQAPQLLEMTGVGAVVAATVLIAWSHPGGVRSEAALASLAGTCPIPASSGNTDRHRLNRGGDRRLNRAIHTIVIVRMRCHEATRAYVARRTTEGRTARSSDTSPASCSARSCRNRYPSALDAI